MTESPKPMSESNSAVCSISSSADRAYWRKFVPYFVVGLFFVVSAMAFRADLERISFSILATSKLALFAVCCLSITSYLIRAWRWRVLLLQIGYRLPVGFALVTYIAGFAFTLAPGKVGELAKYAYYRDYKIPLAEAAGAYSVERITDLAIFVSLALLFFGTANEDYGAILIGTGMCVPIGVLLLAGIPSSRMDSVGNYLLRFGGIWLSAFQQILNAVRVAKSLMSIRLVWYSLVLGFAGWLAECLGLYILLDLSPGASLGIGEAVGIYAVAIVIGAVSFLPGGLGTTEAALAGILASRGVPLADALLITLACRVLTLWLAVGLGWAAVGILKFRGYSRMNDERP